MFPACGLTQQRDYWLASAVTRESDKMTWKESDITGHYWTFSPMDITGHYWIFSPMDLILADIRWDRNKKHASNDVGMMKKLTNSHDHPLSDRT